MAFPSNRSDVKKQHSDVYFGLLDVTNAVF